MSNPLHTMGFAAHVADFHAALPDTENKNARDALILLRGDPIAQIMSFMPCKEERRSLSAVSPQMRLDSEVLADEWGLWRLEPRVRVSEEPLVASSTVAEQVLFFGVKADRDEYNRREIVLALWWSSRYALPVELSLNVNDSELLGHLADTLGMRVKKLRLDICGPPKQRAKRAANSSGTSPATALTSLHSFPNLQSLSIWVRSTEAGQRAAVELLCAVKAAAILPVSMLELEGNEALHDLSALSGSHFLQSLKVYRCGLQSLKGLNDCPTLEKVSIMNGSYLTSVSALAGLPRLHSVEVIGCNLLSLDGLDRCVALQSVLVSCNQNLQSLSPLAGAPFLQILDASSCDLSSVQCLNSCAALTEISVSYNSKLQSLGDLSKAPFLQKVHARGCDLRDLGVAGPWSALREIYVNGNPNLRSVSHLIGAPVLHSIDASACDLPSVQGLGLCAELTVVTLSENHSLRTLGDLSKAPLLQVVIADECDLRDLGVAGPWCALREINVYANRNLRSLSGLAGAPLLEKVYAVSCDIHDFTVLERCPKLRKVDRSERDYSGFESSENSDEDIN